MTEREFCYWLQGLFEIAEPTMLNETQCAMIRDHLKLVFTKVTPHRAADIVNDLQKGLRIGPAQCGPLPNAVAYC